MSLLSVIRITLISLVLLLTASVTFLSPMNDWIYLACLAILLVLSLSHKLSGTNKGKTMAQKVRGKILWLRLGVVLVIAGTLLFIATFFSIIDFGEPGSWQRILFLVYVGFGIVSYGVGAAFISNYLYPAKS